MSELWLKTWFWSGSATGVHFQKRALFSAALKRTGTYLILFDSAVSTDSNGLRIVRLGCSGEEQWWQNEGDMRKDENSLFLLGRFRKKPYLGHFWAKFSATFTVLLLIDCTIQKCTQRRTDKNRVQNPFRKLQWEKMRLLKTAVLVSGKFVNFSARNFSWTIGMILMCVISDCFGLGLVVILNKFSVVCWKFSCSFVDVFVEFAWASLWEMSNKSKLLSNWRPNGV